MTRQGNETAGPRPSSIATLPEMVESLPTDGRDLFHRLYHLSRSVGRLVVSNSSRDWIERSFGSVEAVETQTIVRLTNLITMEGAVFNPLRASRPVETVAGDLQRIIHDSLGDAFCRPEEQTPEDPFGRIRGRHSITASNIAKFAPFHGLVIFDEHDPLKLSEESVRDYMDVGRRWAEEAMKLDPEVRYYFLGWNALWSAGASVIHGHAQVSCSRDLAYAKIEHLRRSTIPYRDRFGASYFEDLRKVHETLGLGFEWEGMGVLAHLTPVRDREVVLVAPAGMSPGGEEALPGAIYRVLECLISTLGTRSFNVALYSPPLAPAPEDWSGFPVMARIVDRGDPMTRTNDVGCMELYGSPVIPTDPFRLIEALRERSGQQ